MAKKPTVLRVDVYPAEWAEDGAVRYRFRVVDAKNMPLAISAKSYARTNSAWLAAAKLLIDPVDTPSAMAYAPKGTKRSKKR